MAARHCVWRPQCSRADGDTLHDCLACGSAFHHLCAATHGGQEDLNLCGRGLALAGAVAGCRAGVEGALNAQQPESDGDDAFVYSKLRRSMSDDNVARKLFLLLNPDWWTPNPGLKNDPVWMGIMEKAGLVEKDEEEDSDNDAPESDAE